MCTLNPCFNGIVLQLKETSQACGMFGSFNPYFNGNSFAIKGYDLSNYYAYESQSLFYWKLLCNEVKRNA